MTLLSVQVQLDNNNNEKLLNKVDVFIYLCVSCVSFSSCDECGTNEEPKTIRYKL